MDGIAENAAGLTQLMYDLATSETLTLAQAVDRLRRDAHIRTVRETLAKTAGMPAEDEKGLGRFLTEKLMEGAPPGTVRDSVERKVRMWLRGDTQTISKEGAVQLVFALGLGVKEAEAFLHRVTGDGFHWRSAEDIVLLYALDAGLSYAAALELREQMKEKGLLSGGNGTEFVHTSIVRREAEQLRSTAELEDYLRGNRDRLGALHNTAYDLFRGYLSLLAAPELNDGLDPEPELSVREITATYLHEKLIPRVRRAAKSRQGGEALVLSALQRDIQQNWPDETTLSKMLNRKTDVTRKTLILLFLATDGGMTEQIEEELFDEEGDFLPEEGFEDLYARMSAMLADCGFAPLDSRSPFDWMILYCMCMEDGMLIDAQVERFLQDVFHGPESP